MPNANNFQPCQLGRESIRSHFIMIHVNSDCTHTVGPGIGYDKVAEPNCVITNSGQKKRPLRTVRVYIEQYSRSAGIVSARKGDQI